MTLDFARKLASIQKWMVLLYEEILDGRKIAYEAGYEAGLNDGRNLPEEIPGFEGTLQRLEELSIKNHSTAGLPARQSPGE